MLTPFLIAAILGYFLGAIPNGYLVARARGVNIFEVGSKSPGATNVKRVLGARAGNLVFALDALKGALAGGWPLVAFALSVAVLGLGGLPPLAGFMSKWQIFVAGFQTQNTTVILLVIFAALNSVLSLGYYAPLVNRMYRYQPSETVKAGVAVPALMQLPLVLLTLATVVLGFWPSLVSWLTEPAGQVLVALFAR